MFPDERFYSALGKIVPVSQDAQTYTSLPRPPITTTAPIQTKSQKKNNKTGLLFAVLGGGAAILAICAMALLGIWIWNSRNPPVAPTSQVVIVTATQSEAADGSARILVTGGTSTIQPSPTSTHTQTKQPTLTLTSTLTSTPLPPSGTCKDGYVHRLIKPNDKVCVSPVSKAQADADNKAAKSRKILAVLLEAYGENACASGYVWRNAYSGDVACVDSGTRIRYRRITLPPPHAGLRAFTVLIPVFQGMSGVLQTMKTTFV